MPDSAVFSDRSHCILGYFGRYIWARYIFEHKSWCWRPATSLFCALSTRISMLMYREHCPFCMATAAEASFLLHKLK